MSSGHQARPILPRDWLPAIEADVRNLRDRNGLLIARIAEMEVLSAGQAARIAELGLAHERETARANRLSDNLSVALNQIDRIVAHSRGASRPVAGRTARNDPAASLPSGVEAPPAWMTVLLIAITAGAAVGILFGFLRPG